MKPNPIPIPSSINPLKPQKHASYRHRHRHHHRLLLLFTISLLTTTTTCYIPTSNTNQQQIQYTKYCNNIVPESPIDSTNAFVPLSTTQSIRFNTASFSGGDPFFNSDQANWPKSATFSPHVVRRTVNNNILKVNGRLTLVIPKKYEADSLRFRRLRQFKVRGPKIPVRRGVASFRVSGYWSEADGKLCLVGSGSTYVNSGNFENFNVVLKLNYSKKLNLSVYDSLVSGVLESVDVEGSERYFKPVSIVGVSQFDQRHYDFTLIGKETRFVDENVKEKSLSFNDVNQGVCSVLGLSNFDFDLEYGGGCGSSNVSCNPVTEMVGYVPNSMFIERIRCGEKQKIQMLLGFWNSTFMGARFPFDPSTTLIAEGTWDEKNNLLHGIACRILNFTGSLINPSIGDCSVMLSLRFPAVFTIMSRSSIVGQIWSNKSENDPGYFGKFGFESKREALAGLPDIKYEYSVVDFAKKSCEKKKNFKHKGKTFPNGYSVDMRFNMLVKNSRGKTARGFSCPLFVADQFYEHQLSGRLLLRPSLGKTAVQLSDNQSGMVNISYKMSFTPSPGFKLSGSEISPSGTIELAAEGVYDRDTGVLCMVGCRQLASNPQQKNSTKNGSLDCEIAVKVKFRALHAEGSVNVKGTIKSMREKSDPLYFGNLELSSNSIYASQAKESIWRMDLEVTMALISNTLACVFVGLQLYHVKKHPDVVPFTSVVMLLILTLRYMIPLLLNFEALFKGNRNQQNFSLGGGGWLETNEILVRVVTMIAFLLQFRLLQLTWSARQGDRSQNNLWVSEKKVLYVCLPLYIVGGFTAGIVYLTRKSHQSPVLQPRQWHVYQQQRFLWVDLKSYAGLILDGFLLPQILFNIFINSTEKALSAYYYLGTTLIGLLPHAYDLYRAHGDSTWYLDLSYIYANHKFDFYSTAWDIIIPCGGLLFAALIFLQQQFGGRCCLSKRYRENSLYEKVPPVSSVELQ